MWKLSEKLSFVFKKTFEAEIIYFPCFFYLFIKKKVSLEGVSSRIFIIIIKDILRILHEGISETNDKLNTNVFQRRIDRNFYARNICKDIQFTFNDKSSIFRDVFSESWQIPSFELFREFFPSGLRAIFFFFRTDFKYRHSDQMEDFSFFFFFFKSLFES